MSGIQQRQQRQQQQQQQHPFNSPLSGTPRVSWYQKDKTNLDLLEQETVSDDIQLQLLQPFYGYLDFVRDKPGEPVPEGTFCHLVDFLVQNGDNTGRCTNNPDGLPPIQTN